jgi:ankyrin repeat protein
MIRLNNDVLNVIMLKCKYSDLKNLYMINKQINKICKSWTFLLKYAKIYWDEVDFPFASTLLKVNISYYRREIYQVAYKIICNLVNSNKFPYSHYSYYEYLKLLKYGIDAKNYDGGNTALMIASSRDHIDIVKMLIANGANINLQNNKGETALLQAIIHGHPDVSRFLVHNHADISIKSNNQYDAQTYAMFFGYDKYMGLS